MIRWGWYNDTFEVWLEAFGRSNSCQLLVADHANWWWWCRQGHSERDHEPWWIPQRGVPLGMHLGRSGRTGESKPNGGVFAAMIIDSSDRKIIIIVGIRIDWIKQPFVNDNNSYHDSISYRNNCYRQFRPSGTIHFDLHNVDCCIPDNPYKPEWWKLKQSSSMGPEYCTKTRF